MKITMAATSAYDANEVYIHLITEAEESIKVGDIIDIPMIDHSFEKREIVAFVSHKKKGKAPTRIEKGESGEAVIYNIHSGWIKTESNIYVDDDITGAVTQI